MPSKARQSRYRHVASARGWRACPLASAALMCERGQQCKNKYEKSSFSPPMKLAISIGPAIRPAIRPAIGQCLGPLYHCILTGY